MFNRTRNAVLKYSAVASVGLMSLAARAQGTELGDILDAVDLSGIATKVGAAGLVIVGVALLFKAPALAKRIVSKV